MPKPVLIIARLEGAVGGMLVGSFWAFLRVWLGSVRYFNALQNGLGAIGIFLGWIPSLGGLIVGWVYGAQKGAAIGGFKGINAVIDGINKYVKSFEQSPLKARPLTPIQQHIKSISIVPHKGSTEREMKKKGLLKQPKPHYITKVAQVMLKVGKSDSSLLGSVRQILQTLRSSSKKKKVRFNPSLKVTETPHRVDSEERDLLKIRVKNKPKRISTKKHLYEVSNEDLFQEKGLTRKPSFHPRRGVVKFGR